jgi:hypothetical protein
MATALAPVRSVKFIKLAILVVLNWMIGFFFGYSFRESEITSILQSSEITCPNQIPRSVMICLDYETISRELESDSNPEP